MTLKLFFLALLLSMGLLILGKIYEGRGSYKLFKLCNLLSSVVLLCVLVGGVADVVWVVLKIFL